MNNTMNDAANRDNVMVQPPLEHKAPKISAPKEVAAGLPAVLSSSKYAFEQSGALQGLQLLSMINQKGGVDCPSCAWPDPDDERSFAEYCENGARAISDEGTKRKVNPAFFKRHSIVELSQQSDHWLNQQGRLTQPMYLAKGASHYQPISWDDAFNKLGYAFQTLDSPQQAIFYTSGRTSNEAAFLYQLFVRQLGTNNMPDCSNMCHESSGTALSETLGLGKGSVTLEDFEHAEVILVIGQNPGTNHPRMLSALEKAKAKGAEVVSINPLPETGLVKFKNPQDFMNPLKAFHTLLGEGSAIADVHMPVRIGGDIAVLKGVMKYMLEQADQGRPVFDETFINEHTEGFDAVIDKLRNADWDTILHQSGISREQIAQVAEMCIGSGKIICCWAMGLTQHPFAVANIQEVVNLLLMRGSIGKQGAGTCPVRGHSNVQGDRTMGIWEKPKDAFLDALGKEFNFEPPREHGYDTVEAIRAMYEGKAKVFFAMGGNFLSATPDTEYTAQALRRCELTVQVSTKLNRSHLVTGQEALILPCLGRTELDMQASGQQFVSVENSMGVVHSSTGKIQPASEHLLSEPMIVARMAAATLKNSGVEWLELANNYNLIRDHIAKVIPGFENYNQKVRQDGGFYLPNGPRQGTFSGKNAKAQFTVHDIPNTHMPQGHYLMMTIRSHDQFNTTVYDVNDRYRGIKGGRRVLLMNPQDMQKAGIQQGDKLDITSHFGDETREAKSFTAVAYPIPTGCTASYFPETNVLVPINSVALKSNTPASKFVEISVRSA